MLPLEQPVRLVGLTLAADMAPDAGPAAAAVISAGERNIGRVTSLAWSPMLRAPIALGSVHRDFVAPGTAVTVNGQPATVTALPFVP